jgi:hypothetical protein
MNKLFYGGNLDILPGLSDESVNLVYPDPPFNSNCRYNVIFGRDAGSSDTDASAQIQAFDDTWHWTPVTDAQYQQYASRAAAWAGRGGAESAPHAARRERCHGLPSQHGPTTSTTTLPYFQAAKVTRPALEQMTLG